MEKKKFHKTYAELQQKISSIFISIYHPSCLRLLQCNQKDSYLANTKET